MNDISRWWQWVYVAIWEVFALGILGTPLLIGGGLTGVWWLYACASGFFVMMFIYTYLRLTGRWR